MHREDSSCNAHEECLERGVAVIGWLMELPGVEAVLNAQGSSCAGGWERSMEQEDGFADVLLKG